MSREFKSSTYQFNTFIGVGIMSIVLTIFGYLLLDIIIVMIPIFGALFTVLAFWGKDRVLVTLYDDYLEAKEGIAAKKKLIKYADITKAELHKSGRIITLFVLINGKEKKEIVNMNPIQKEERKELFDLINTKITAVSIQ